jgi:hypothetical protein
MIRKKQNYESDYLDFSQDIFNYLCENEYNLKSICGIIEKELNKEFIFPQKVTFAYVKDINGLIIRIDVGTWGYDSSVSPNTPYTMRLFNITNSFLDTPCKIHTTLDNMMEAFVGYYRDKKIDIINEEIKND